MVKGKYELKTLKPGGIDTNGKDRRKAEGVLSPIQAKLLPEAREAIYQYQDQFAETHGWVPNTSYVINELILIARYMRENVSDNILPGYSPGLWKSQKPIQGQKVIFKGEEVTVLEVLPGEKALIKKGGKKTTVWLRDLIEA